MELMSSRRRRVSWLDLPTQVLYLIIEFLDKVEDVRNFRSVCKGWRRATLFPGLLPWRFKIGGASHKLISSAIFLLYPPNSPHTSPCIVLAVEATKGVIQFFNPFSRTPLPNLPHNFDYTHFGSNLVVAATGYHLVADDHDHDQDLFSSIPDAYAKVSLFLHYKDSSIPRYHLWVLCPEGQVRLDPFRKAAPKWPINQFKDIDDLIQFQGKMYVIDKLGTLSCCARRELRECKIMVSSGISLENSEGVRRKRLVVSSSGDKLFLVVPIDVNVNYRNLSSCLSLIFKVYELKNCDKPDSSWVWDEIISFSDADAVLVISKDYCFFVSPSAIPECQLRDCIVFSEDAFPICSASSWSYENMIGDRVSVSFLGRLNSNSLECYPSFCRMLSLPPWVSHSASFPLQLPLQSEPMVEDITLFDSYSKDRASSLQEEELPAASSPPEAWVETIGSPVMNDMDLVIEVETPTSPGMNDMDLVIEAPVETPTSPGMNDMDLVIEASESLKDAIAQTQTDSVTELLQPLEKKVVTFKFHGIDVESDHLPVLQKVWMFHGDAFEGSAISSCDIITTALASLAKMVLILQTNSGKTLTDDQAGYLRKTLSDLQFMQLKVDWLAPSVKKALAIHERKQLQASLVELEKAKVKAEEMERKFLSEMAEMKQGLDVDIRHVSECLLESEPLDLDECLGQGLC